MDVGGFSDHLVSHFRTLSPKTYDGDDEDVVMLMDVSVTREIKPGTVEYESCYDVVRGRRAKVHHIVYVRLNHSAVA